MSFNQISHINLFSENNQRLIEFYKSIGMEARNKVQSGNYFGFDTEGVNFAIEPQANHDKVASQLNIPGRDDQVLIQFRAATREELESMTVHLKDLGIEILRDCAEASYGTVTNFRDPDGNLLEILLPKQ